MATKSTASASASLFLALALALAFFAAAATACGCGCSSCPTPTPPKPPSPTPKPPSPTPRPPSPPGGGGGGGGKCQIDALKFGVCANVLNGLINIELGQPPKKPCCTLIQDLADLEAAVCLCTALKANILGINLNVPIDLSLLINYCGKSVPAGFQCP